MRVFVFIPTRMDSKRLPGKPMLEVAGKKVIEHCYETTRCSGFRPIILTPDEPIWRYMFIQKRATCFIVKSECRNGTERCFKAANLIPGIQDDDIIINVQGDNIFYDYRILEEIVDVLKSEKNLTCLTVFTSLKKQLQNCHNVVKVFIEVGPRRYLKAVEFSRISTSREGLTSHRHVGIYAYPFWGLKKYMQLSPTIREQEISLEQLRLIDNGIEIGAVKTDIPPISIDVPEDIAIAENRLLELRHG